MSASITLYIISPHVHLTVCLFPYLTIPFLCFTLTLFTNKTVLTFPMPFCVPRYFVYFWTLLFQSSVTFWLFTVRNTRLSAPAVHRVSDLVLHFSMSSCIFYFHLTQQVCLVAPLLFCCIFTSVTTEITTSGIFFTPIRLHQALRYLFSDGTTSQAIENSYPVPIRIRGTSHSVEVIMCHQLK